MRSPRYYRKAVVSAAPSIVIGLQLLVELLGDRPIQEITLREWLLFAISLLTIPAVYSVKNAEEPRGEGGPDEPPGGDEADYLPKHSE